MQPSSNQLLQPQSTNVVDGSLIGNNGTSKSSIPVGSTWSNSGSISIDLDNLLSGKSKHTGPVLSMNQLKIQSPVKTQPTSLGIQPNLIGGSGGTILSPQQKPQYSNIPIQQQQTSQLFGGVQTPTNLNNQFNAFQ